MRVRSCISGLAALLLALGVCSISVSPPPRDRAPSPGRMPSPSGTSQALSDLDGDGLADPVLLNTGGLQHNIELHLSRADDRVVLPVSAEVGGDGSFLMQDIDGDGDTDLLWQGSLPPHAVMVWLNDGAGRFECLCPPESHEGGFALGGPGVGASRPRRPDSALSPERNPSQGYALASRWDYHVAATLGLHRPESVSAWSCLKRFPSNRSPPLLLC